MTSIRCFVAIELPQEIKQSLAGAQRILMQGLPGGLGPKLRWVAPEGIHLTLKFLGAVAEDKVAAVEQALGLYLTGAEACEARLKGIGMFPSQTRPRVVWIGLEDEQAALSRIQRMVEQATASLGFSMEARPFNPHLTLARVREDATSSERAALGKAVVATEVDLDRKLRVDRVSLTRSDLRPTGAIYSRIAAMELRTV